MRQRREPMRLEEPEASSPGSGSSPPLWLPISAELRSGSTSPNAMTLPSFSANGTSSGITTGLNGLAR